MIGEHMVVCRKYKEREKVAGSVCSWPDCEAERVARTPHQQYILSLSHFLPELIS